MYYGMLSELRDERTFLWTGYKDDESEGVFKTQTGEIAAWTNWGNNHYTGTQEPDGGRRENCVGLFNPDFLWHDLNCDKFGHALCIWYP